MSEFLKQDLNVDFTLYLLENVIEAEALDVQLSLNLKDPMFINQESVQVFFFNFFKSISEIPNPAVIEIDGFSKINYFIVNDFKFLFKQLKAYTTQFNSQSPAFLQLRTLIAKIDPTLDENYQKTIEKLLVAWSCVIQRKEDQQHKIQKVAEKIFHLKNSKEDDDLIFFSTILWYSI